MKTASNSVSIFAAGPNGLQLADSEDSGGDRPISMTACGHQRYVVDPGGTGSITGFTFGAAGQLSPLAGSTQP